MARAADARPLEGVGVLVTRPSHQAGPLCRLIESQGGTAIRFPVLEILDPHNSQPLRDSIDRLDGFDCAVFISANAVNRALKQILARRDWPRSVQIAVIGKRSAEELQRFGLAADICPQARFSSEALLELPEMHQVQGRRFVIFRGEGGREFLADSLRERGAWVEYVEAYRRARPHLDSADLVRRWQQGEVDIVLVNSTESLRNLVELVGEAGTALFAKTALLVVSERIVELAGQLGFKTPPVVADSATDQAVLAALLAWRQFH